MSNLNLITIGRAGKTLASMALIFILFCHIAIVSAQDRCWTAVGSDGTVDEADLSTVALSANSAAVRSTVTNATIDIRYNVVAVDGIFGDPRHTKSLTVRFADNGAAARVVVRLQRMEISTGVVTTLVELNSNDYAPSTVAQTQTISFNCDGPEFDFQKNIYYIEVQLIKTGASGKPLIHVLQICNSVC